MTAETKATARPWRIVDLGTSKRGNPLDATLAGPNGLPMMFIPYTSDIAKANAELIVRAVNSHDALVRALSVAKHYLDCLDMETADEKVREDLQTINAALKLARGEGE